MNSEANRSSRKDDPNDKDDSLESKSSPSKPKKKKSTKDKDLLDDSKARGWPKGKKRFLKAPGAPKINLSAYVHFLNERRESKRNECPDLSFIELSKELASEWSALDSESKIPYNIKAEKDKERYGKEFSVYQKTDEYKEHLEEVKKHKKAEAEEKERQKKESKAIKAASKATAASSSTTASHSADKSGAATPNDNVENSSAIEDLTGAAAGLNFPIFTKEFLEHNKTKETELRQLKRQVIEMEEQNAKLESHVDSMKAAIRKLETESKQQQENNAAIVKHLDELKNLVVTRMRGVRLHLPGYETVDSQNVEGLMKVLHAMLVEKSRPKDELLVGKIRDLLAPMDYSSLTTM